MSPSTVPRKALRAWLRLLTCSTLIERDLRTKFRANFDLALPQFDILAELDHAGQPQTMSELSRRLMVSNGNVTNLVDRLVENGLVARSPLASDRRVHLIALTESGRAEFAKMASAHEQWIGEMLSEVSNEDLDRLSALLDSVKGSLRVTKP